jgi:hypothetical protein
MTFDNPALVKKSLLHKFTQNPGAGGTIFLIQVALLSASNYSLERNGGLRDQLCFKVQVRPLNSRLLG